MPITKNMSAGEVIKDFQQSDAPQFKNKSKEKIKQMALAAFMSKQNESVELEEGISKQHPIEGHPYHSKTNDQLHFIIKDAGAAAKAQKGMSSEGKYLDQQNDAATVLGFRKRAAHPKTGNLPNWYLNKYFPKAGVNEEVELEESSTCSRCKGHGEVKRSVGLKKELCPNCGGTGIDKDKDSVTEYHPNAKDYQSWKKSMKEEVKLEESTVAGGQLVGTWEFNPPKSYKGNKVGDRHLVKHGTYYSIHADDDQYSRIDSGTLSRMMDRLKHTHKPKLPSVKEDLDCRVCGQTPCNCTHITETNLVTAANVQNKRFAQHQATKTKDNPKGNPETLKKLQRSVKLSAGAFKRQVIDKLPKMTNADYAAQADDNAKRGWTNEEVLLDEMGGLNMKNLQSKATISFHGKEGYAVTHKGQTTHHDTHEQAVKHANSLSSVVHDVTESVDSSTVLHATVARHKLKQIEKSGKKKSQELYNKLVRKANADKQIKEEIELEENTKYGDELKKLINKYSSHNKENTSYNIGGNFSKSSSGKIEYSQTHNHYGGQYGFNRTLHHTVKIGTSYPKDHAEKFKKEYDKLNSKHGVKPFESHGSNYSTYGLIKEDIDLDESKTLGSTPQTKERSRIRMKELMMKLIKGTITADQKKYLQHVTKSALSPAHGVREEIELDEAQSHYEIMHRNGKTSRFVASTENNHAEAKNKAKGLGAKSLIRVTQFGKPIGKIGHNLLEEVELDEAQMKAVRITYPVGHPNYVAPKKAAPKPKTPRLAKEIDTSDHKLHKALEKHLGGSFEHFESEPHHGHNEHGHATMIAKVTHSYTHEDLGMHPNEMEDTAETYRVKVTKHPQHGYQVGHLANKMNEENENIPDLSGKKGRKTANLGTKDIGSKPLVTGVSETLNFAKVIARHHNDVSDKKKGTFNTIPYVRHAQAVLTNHPNAKPEYKELLNKHRDEVFGRSKGPSDDYS